LTNTGRVVCNGSRLDAKVWNTQNSQVRRQVAPNELCGKGAIVGSLESQIFFALKHVICCEYEIFGVDNAASRMTLATVDKDEGRADSLDCVSHLV
jgi:hypothetical protein